MGETLSKARQLASPATSFILKWTNKAAKLVYKCVSVPFSFYERHEKKCGRVLALCAFLIGLGTYIVQEQRNTASDISSAWQLLAQDRSGDLGRSFAINLLSSTQCIKVANLYEKLHPALDGSYLMSQCYWSGHGLRSGPFSLQGLNLSSSTDSGNILNKLNVANQNFRHANFNKIRMMDSAIVSSDFAESSFEAAEFYNSKLYNNNFEHSLFKCSAFFGTDFFKEFVSSSNMNNTLMLFSIFSFERELKKDEITQSTVPITHAVEYSQNIDLSQSEIISSDLFFAESELVIAKNSVIRFSRLHLLNTSVVDLSNSDLSYSTIDGSLTGAFFSGMFDNTNLSGADLSNLKGIPEGALDKAYYCGEIRAKLPRDYVMWGPSSRVCGGNGKDFDGLMSTIKAQFPEMNVDKASGYFYRLKTPSERGCASTKQNLLAIPDNAKIMFIAPDVFAYVESTGPDGGRLVKIEQTSGGIGSYLQVKRILNYMK